MKKSKKFHASNLPILSNEGHEYDDDRPKREKQRQQILPVESIRQISHQNPTEGEDEDVDGTDQDLIRQSTAEVVVYAQPSPGRRNQR